MACRVSEKLAYLGALAHLIEHLLERGIHLFRRVVGAGGDLAADEVHQFVADAADLRRLNGRLGCRRNVHAIDGATVTSKQGARLRVLVDARADVGEILATARQAGEVTSFAFEPPSLTDLFLDAISKGQAA